MTRPTFMHIDLHAVHHNLARIKALAPQQKIIAMVKANAYGHGSVCIAQALHQADALGVASLDEANVLRAAGIKQPIVLMEGLFTSDEMQEAASQGYTLIVRDFYQIDMLENAKMNHRFKVWLKVNTGMHRLGIAPADFKQAYDRLNQVTTVKQPIGLMTHFAEADDTVSHVTQHQMELFKRLTEGLSGERSLANSAAIFAWPTSHGDWVRPGLALYGASPFIGRSAAELGLKPVMTMWSKLISVSNIKKGARVGYSGTWIAPEDMVLGIVGAGYGDGYPQGVKSGSPVLVNGVECQTAGRVSMDMFAVDLRMCPEAKIGDRVVLWGEGLPVERVAQHAGTSAYEMLTRVTARPTIQIIN